MATSGAIRAGKDHTSFLWVRPAAPRKSGRPVSSTRGGRATGPPGDRRANAVVPGQRRVARWSRARAASRGGRGARFVCRVPARSAPERGTPNFLTAAVQHRAEEAFGLFGAEGHEDSGGLDQRGGRGVGGGYRAGRRHAAAVDRGDRGGHQQWGVERDRPAIPGVQADRHAGMTGSGHHIAEHLVQQHRAHPAVREAGRTLEGAAERARPDRQVTLPVHLDRGCEGAARTGDRVVEAHPTGQVVGGRGVEAAPPVLGERAGRPPDAFGGAQDLLGGRLGGGRVLDQ